MAKFKKGESGNSAGRPAGIEDRRMKYRKLLEPHAENLIQKAVDLALSGDATALRLCLERIVPAIKSRDETVALPLVGTAKSLTERGEAILAALGAGILSPSEAGGLIQALAAQSRITEIDELEKRIAQLEGKTYVT